MWLKNDSLAKIPDVKSFSVSEEGDWIAYLNTKDNRPKCPTYKKWQIFKKRKKCFRPKTTGHSLTVLNPLTAEQFEIHRVVNYRFNKNGDHLYYSKSQKGESDSLTLFAIDLKSHKIDTIIKNQLDIGSLTLDDNGNQMAFTTTTDTNEAKTYQLAYWAVGDSKVKILVDTNTNGLKEGWAVSEYSNTYFSKNGNYIYFGTNEQVEQEPEDSLLSSEKAKLDVWSWTDKQVQPQQLKQLRRQKKKSFNTRVNLANLQITHLETEANESVILNTNLDQDKALVRNTDPYLKYRSWEFPWKSDYSIIDLETGEKETILEAQAFFPSLSPSGKYLAWYSGLDSSWRVTSIDTKTTVNLTEGIPDIFYSDNNGNPSQPFPRGLIGWTNLDGKEQALIQSEFDIYEFDPTKNSQYQVITNELGKTNKTKYFLVNFDQDSAYIDLNRVLLKGINRTTKAECFVKNLDFSNPVLKGNYSLNWPVKAPKSDKLYYRPMTVSQYPDIVMTDLSFKNQTTVTNANPQQSDYNWATVEQVKWDSYKGLQLDGLLYKPENFDSTKQYPMIVYFYEKYDDRLHNYYAPRPTASIVHATEYASNGYIVFIPNILYTPGHPAQSAYDCIVSGTDYLTKQYDWIDTNKLALQGQSWGGYQTAQLITMTNKYACAMAGAPVSNMFSAYGGIRWGSGMSRQFQYERTQSRIGCNIWECPELLH